MIHAGSTLPCLTADLERTFHRLVNNGTEMTVDAAFTVLFFLADINDTGIMSVLKTGCEGIEDSWMLRSVMSGISGKIPQQILTFQRNLCIISSV